MSQGGWAQHLAKPLLEAGCGGVQLHESPLNVGIGICDVIFLKFNLNVNNSCMVIYLWQIGNHRKHDEQSFLCQEVSF